MHMHHLLNEFRPHQARETLRVMMEMQKRQRLETTSRFKKHLRKVRGIANKGFSALPEITSEDLAQTESILTIKHDLTTSPTIDVNFQMDCAMCEIIDNMK